MECKKIDILLWDIVDKKTDPNTQEIILKHIEKCTVCKAKYNLLIEANKFIDFQKNIEINPFIETRIIEKIRKDKVSVFQKVLQPAFIGILILFSIFIGNKTATFITNQTQKSTNSITYQNNDSVYFMVFNSISQEEYQFLNNK